MINHPSRVEVHEMVSLIPSPGLSPCDGLVHSRAGVELHAMVYLIPELGLNSCDYLLNSRAGVELHAMVSLTSIWHCLSIRLHMRNAPGSLRYPGQGEGHAHNYALPIFGTKYKCLYNYMA